MMLCCGRWVRGVASRGFYSGKRERLIPVGKGGLADGLVVRVTVPEYFERISRSRQGWAHPWAEIEKVLVRANQIMAEDLQLMAAMELEESRSQTRAKYSTGRLEATILSPENIINTGRRWGVGKKQWMDTASPARMYWRQIEDGSTVHLERRVHGLFSDGVSFFKASPARRGLDDVLVGEVHGFVIKNPIEAQKFFRNAWRRYNTRARARAALQAAIQEVLGVTFRSNRPQWNTLINSMR